MRTTIFLFMLLSASLTCSTYAQDIDDEEELGTDCTCEEGDEGFVIEVKPKGTKPNILDFARAYFDFVGYAEGISSAYKAFKEYERKRTVSHGKLTVDTANGYLCYSLDWTEIDPEIEEKSILEMCYWNMADGKHKLFATNNKCFVEGRYVCTETTGSEFFVYDNEKRVMEHTSSEDIGAYIEGCELVWPETDYEDWVKMPNYPEYLPLFTLPRNGKTIEVGVHQASMPDNAHRNARLTWDGRRFNKTFDR